MSDTGREGRQGELALVVAVAGGVWTEPSALRGRRIVNLGGASDPRGRPLGIGRAGGRGDGIGSRMLAGDVVEEGMALELVGVGAGVGVRLVTTEGVGGGNG